MVRCVVGLLLAVAITSGGSPQPSRSILSVCDLSRDFAAYRDKVVAVRGVYWYCLRQACPQKCANGPWPSFLDLIGSESPGSDEGAWDSLDKAQRKVELEAKKGKRLEIWVTAVGQLRTRAQRSPLGPCDKIGSRYYGYGHLGGFPAELVVKSFSDIKVK